MKLAEQHELIGRVLADKEFRDALWSDPETCLKNNGFSSAPDLVAAIQSCNPELLNQLVATFEQGPRTSGTST